VPCRLETATFKEPKRDPKPIHAVVGPTYDTNNKAITDIDPYVEVGNEPDPMHQPMRYKLPTSQS